MHAVALAWMALAVALVPLQLFVTAPYGRHVRGGWGPRISNRLGWLAMESVSLVVFAALFLIGPAHKSASAWVFFAAWVAHYVNRALVFPWRLRGRDKTMPLAIAGSAALFNTVNAGLNGVTLGWIAYPESWLADPRFVLGLALFICGAALNLWADGRLMRLRTPQADYALPRGGMFERVSCPNHLGEILEWSGFALRCWNLAALSFAIWTAANLIPRALSHHRWYEARFPAYPPARKAVIPWLL
ncbi:MAG: 3-oxo-5-alpha-steroid 4-dehydrogenase [Alphaproteobacteria bacterium]|nr:3-oxo-5-alpha-steroid 4-dehydrogenase [Alphaproteobacteria bacterium]